MPYPKGHPRPPGSGRARGTLNRTTAHLRAVVAEALDGAGGAAYLADVARERPELFLPLVRKVLPRDATQGALEEAVRVVEAARLLGRPQMAAQDGPGATNAGRTSLGSPSSLVSLAASLEALRAPGSPPDFGGEAA